MMSLNNGEMVIFKDEGLRVDEVRCGGCRHHSRVTSLAKRTRYLSEQVAKPQAR